MHEGQSTVLRKCTAQAQCQARWRQLHTRPTGCLFHHRPRHPTIIFGADAIHPAPGTSDRPSFTALVGNVDSGAAKYVATMRAQETRKEIIQDLQSMVTVSCLLPWTYIDRNSSVFALQEILKMYMGYQAGVEKKAQPAPKRLLFYRDGVSEGEFIQVLEEGSSFCVISFTARH